MKTKQMKKFITLFLSLALILSTSLSSFAAAIKTADSVTPDRTLQNRETGVLTYQTTIVPHGGTSTTISGSVVIDGPKLVLKVNGVDISNSANLVKVADKTWTFSYQHQFNPTSYGDQNLSIEAYTIYINGKTAGNVHTSATASTAIVHIPYVTGFTVSHTWGVYNPQSQTYPLQYQITYLWSDANNEVGPMISTDVLAGTTYDIVAQHPSHNGNSSVVIATVTAPAAPVAPQPLTVTNIQVNFIRSEEIANNTGNPNNTTYNNDRVYYEIIVTFSNGTTATFEDNVVMPNNKANNVTSKEVQKNITIADQSFDLVFTVVKP